MEQPTLGSLEICLAQKANMEAIFHAVADGIITVDPQLRVSGLNRAAETLLGVGAADGIARSVDDVLPGQLWDVGALLRAIMKSREPARNRENLITRQDGEERRVLVTASHLLDKREDLAGAVIVFRDITEIRALEARLEQRAALHGLVGKARSMQEIYHLIEQVAPTDSTVLIQGESGTGKELVADAIHRSSRRQNGPFIKVNCSALSEHLLESELFGHVKGSFTGATHDRKGRFELADGGTLFLDEIGDLSEAIQVKLLRVIQEREIERVGDTKTVPINVRVIAATHRQLRKLVEEGRFRDDLYYRLNVIPIDVPPLRSRREDIPDLAALFLGVFAEQMGKEVSRISPDALRAFLDYRWPGNVRELRNAVEHGVVKCLNTTLLVEDLPREIAEEAGRRVGAPQSSGGGRSSRASNYAQSHRIGDDQAAIRDALERTGWNRGRAAKLLGIERTTLWRKMKKLGIGQD